MRTIQDIVVEKIKNEKTNYIFLDISWVVVLKLQSIEINMRV